WNYLYQSYSAPVPYKDRILAQQLIRSNDTGVIGHNADCAFNSTLHCLMCRLMHST
ncbi:unnamed protein product, partial [Adineta ricciae]